MGLGLFYKVGDDFFEVSTDDDLSSPVITTHDGKRGDSQKVKLYLKNDDSMRYFTNIVITPFDNILPSDIDYASTGWGVKLSNKLEEPSTAEWEDIDWGASITVADIEDVPGTVSFWYLVSCPPNTDAQNKTDITLKIAYTENVYT
jgi:hypothetical protein